MGAVLAEALISLCFPPEGASAGGATPLSRTAVCYLPSSMAARFEGQTRGGTPNGGGGAGAGGDAVGVLCTALDLLFEVSRIWS